MVDRYDAEIVVVGAGPAGIAAACVLAEAGRQVLLVDENPAVGGQIWRHRQAVELPVRARQWLDRLARSPVQRLQGTAVVDGRATGVLWGEGEGGAVEIRSEIIILATGARELFLPFPGWTLPGILGIGAVQALIKAGVDLQGLRVVIAGSGPLMLPVGVMVDRSGAELALIAEQASWTRLLGFGAGLWRVPRKAAEAIVYRSQAWRSRYRAGVWVDVASGDDHVREVVLTDGRRRWSERCDLLCCAYGLIPNLELARWLGCRIEMGRVVVNGNLETNLPNTFCVGEATGVGGVELALVEGQMVAAHLSGDRATLEGLARERQRLHHFAAGLERAFAPRPELADRVRPETIVCRCEDVPYGRIDPAWCARQAKLYTRVGMGPCQGRICGAATRFLFGWEADSVRPPLTACRVQTLEDQGG